MPKLRSHGPALLLCCGQNHCPCARDSRRLDGQELGSLKETIDKTLGLAVRAEKENNSDKAGRDGMTLRYCAKPQKCGQRPANARGKQAEEPSTHTVPRGRNRAATLTGRKPLTGRGRGRATATAASTSASASASPSASATNGMAAARGTKCHILLGPCILVHATIEVTNLHLGAHEHVVHGGFLLLQALLV